MFVPGILTIAHAAIAAIAAIVRIPGSSTSRSAELDR